MNRIRHEDADGDYDKFLLPSISSGHSNSRDSGHSTADGSEKSLGSNGNGIAALRMSFPPPDDVIDGENQEENEEIPLQIESEAAVDRNRRDSLRVSWHKKGRKAFCHLAAPLYPG